MVDPNSTWQEELERRSASLGSERFLERVEKAQESGFGAVVAPGRNLVRENLPRLTKALDDYLREKRSSPGRNGVAAEWIKAVEPDMAAWVTLQVVLRGFPEDRDAQKVAREISRHLQLIRHASRSEGSLHGGGLSATQRRIREAAGDLGDLAFKPNQAPKIGGTLLTLLLNHTCLVELDELRDGKKAFRGRNVVFTDDTRLKIYEQSIALANRWPKYAPMVVRPIPWSPTSRGGYVGILQGRLPLIKGKPTADTASIDPVLFTSLNRIQETPWAINRAVLEVAEEIKQAGTQQLARTPFSLDPRRNARSKDERTRLAKVRRFHATLEVAREMAEAERIYFPHHLDFRGRIYPIPEWLNPHGDDFARALLCFADGKPLGDEGPFWLALHGANCLGNTPEGVNLAQETLEGRVTHIEGLAKQIEDAATDPLASDLMKVAAEHGDPWQFYTFAIEWTKYVQEAAQGRGAKFVSYLPCGQDGSCNGLQHIAALWRNEELARRVNLLPSERPNDFYTDMLHTVEKRLQSEAQGQVQLPRTWTRKSTTEKKKEVERRSELATKWLGSGFLTRRLMKTPAMTFGYGASRWRFTRETADHIREQIPDPFDRPFSVNRRLRPDEVFEADPNVVPSAPPSEEERERLRQQYERGPDPWDEMDPDLLKAIDQGWEELQSTMLRELWSEEGMAFDYLAGIMYDVMQAEAGEYRKWFRKAARSVVGRKKATPKEIKAWTPSVKVDNAGRPVAWTVPITGLRVVQNVPKYWEQQEKRAKPIKIEGAVAGITYQERRPTTLVRVTKQVSSLAPNVVHSLDAAHLVLTVELAAPVVASWGVIHDSFHVLAADAPILAQALLEAFRQLHEPDILGDLQREFAEQAGSDLPAAPPRGNLKITNIQGRYAFA